MRPSFAIPTTLSRLKFETGTNASRTRNCPHVEKLGLARAVLGGLIAGNGPKVINSLTIAQPRVTYEVKGLLGK